MSLLTRDDEADRHRVHIFSTAAASWAPAFRTAWIGTPPIDRIDTVTPRTLQPPWKSHHRQHVHVAGVIIRMHRRQSKAANVQAFLQPGFVDRLVVTDTATVSGNAVPFLEPREDSRDWRAGSCC